MIGASLTLSYAPFEHWWLAIISFSGFFYLLIQTKHKTASTWWFAFGWFGAGISWVHVSIADFGGVPLVFSVLMMAGLCGYLALFPALAVKLLQRCTSVVFWPMILPLLWVLTEWLRSWFLTGFPWLSIGYSQLHSPLGGWLPVIGETGVSGMLVLMTSAVALAIHQKNWRFALMSITIPLISGAILNPIEWTKPSGKQISTAIIQGNIKQELRWAPEQDLPTMQRYLQDTQQYLGHDLIIWPEAAIPKLESLATEYITALDEMTAASNSSLITGIVNYNYESEQVYNSLITLGNKLPGDKQGNYRYFHNNRFDKQHLLPIGEFVPFENVLRRLAPIFDLPMSSFTRGDFQQRNLVANGINIAPAICFEIAFPRQVRANLYAETEVILTVSNDAWFGRSHGPAQHMEIAQVRAKEMGLPLIRSTNNGISAFVDHRGNITDRLTQFERTSMSSMIALVNGTTPYRQFGDLGIWLITLSFAIAGFIVQRQTKHIKNQPR